MRSYICWYLFMSSGVLLLRVRIEHESVLEGMKHHFSERGKLFPDGATFLVNRSYRVPAKSRGQ